MGGMPSNQTFSTKLTVNIKAFAVSVATAALAFTTAYAAPEAKAYTSCSTFGNTTYCNGSSGSSTYSTYGGTTYYNGNYNGNSYSGSCSTYGSTTYCN